MRILGTNIEFLLKIIKSTAMNEKVEYIQWAVLITEKFQKFLNLFKKFFKNPSSVYVYYIYIWE